MESQAQISTLNSTSLFFKKFVIFFLLAETFDRVVSCIFFLFFPFKANKSIIPKISVCINLTFGANHVIQPSARSSSIAFFLITASFAMVFYISLTPSLALGSLMLE